MTQESTPPASQSEALVEELAQLIEAALTRHGVADFKFEGTYDDALSILPILDAHIAAAIQADRRGRTFSPTELDRARAEGRREGIEEAAELLEADSATRNPRDPMRNRANCFAAAIRALAEKQP